MHTPTLNHNHFCRGEWEINCGQIPECSALQTPRINQFLTLCTICHEADFRVKSMKAFPKDTSVLVCVQCPAESPTHWTHKLKLTSSKPHSSYLHQNPTFKHFPCWIKFCNETHQRVMLQCFSSEFKVHPFTDDTAGDAARFVHHISDNIRFW